MGDTMASALTGLYTKGDLEQLRAHLLHSSAWVQHQMTAYGDEQITQCWMQWLACAGRSQCESVTSLVSEQQRLEVLELLPDKGSTPVRVGLWSWHNGDYIKRLICQVDTQLLAESLDWPMERLLAVLPDADPLVISDYDQRKHPHSVDVCPTDLLTLSPDVAAVTARWWRFWQNAQLAEADEIYDSSSIVLLPGAASSTDVAGLIDYRSQWSLRQRRRFYQPESVLADPAQPGALAILWHMEGDMDSARGVRRVRVPVISRLDIEAGIIRRETMLVDDGALTRRLTENGDS